MDNSSEAQSLFNTAWSAEHRGEFERAMGWYQEAAAKAQSSGALEIEMLSYSNMVNVCIRVGRGVRGAEIATHLLLRSRQNNLPLYEMRAIGRLVEALLFLNPRGKWAEIPDLIDKGLELAYSANISFWQAYFEILRARGALAVDELQLARDSLYKAKSRLIIVTDDKPVLDCFITDLFAQLEYKRGNHEEASRYAEVAINTAEIYNIADQVFRGQLTLAHVEQQRNQAGEALRLVEIVLKGVESLGLKGIEQEARYLEGKLTIHLGHYERAKVSLKQSLSLAIEMSTVERQVLSYILLGQVFSKLESSDEAVQNLQNALTLCNQHKFKHYLSEIEDLLRQFKE
jgi:tetratricopeptide (TPR) repeat protein